VALGRRHAPAKPLFDEVDDWLDRIQLVDEGDDEVAKFLDSLDLRGPQEREMLEELARKAPLAKPDAFAAAHRRAVASLETLGRHGYRSAVLPRWLKPRFFGRFVVELVARYVVVSYLRRVATELRNIYWLRAIQAAGTTERPVLRRARVEADGLMVIFSRRELGLPSFVVGGILVPVVLTLLRLVRGLSLGSWWASTIVSVVGALVVLVISAVILRGAAMASRRIRLATRARLEALYETIGSCGQPPHDQSRKFAVVAIVLTTLAWFVFPAVIAIAVLT
jgi:uncharacterized membrane protein YeaQ/YmgE (transglycosylase-associated protein family)